MTAYLIAAVDVTNPEGYKEYTALVPASLAPYGGRFLARGGKRSVLEGEWDPKRIVIIEFDDVERLNQWWNSDEYEAIKPLRHQNAVSRIMTVEGVKPE